MDLPDDKCKLKIEIQKEKENRRAKKDCMEKISDKKTSEQKQSWTEYYIEQADGVILQTIARKTQNKRKYYFVQSSGLIEKF